jgi:hypothetical protein
MMTEISTGRDVDLKNMKFGKNMRDIKDIDIQGDVNEFGENKQIVSFVDLMVEEG